MKQYDKITNQCKNKLPDLPFLIVDRRHSTFGHVCGMSRTLKSIRPYTYQLKSSPALYLLRAESAHWVVYGEHGSSNWKKTLAYIFVLLIWKSGSQFVEIARTLVVQAQK